ncbi:adenosine 5'-monophosphoramidase HINT3-like isoform X2 [Schistocerca americana]|uniref:adenosine 5'-monophosphoramidase HINT3-like isoform X2 n=1 Tax=Schistocerca americana TaxID=7009 RepID=UPI001F4F7C42|nr:adenosine 5'-monophosphoramidase HINT3-like isoform X2 [Schistocerca americana]
MTLTLDDDVACCSVPLTCDKTPSISIEDMVRIGKEVLEERGGDVSDLRLGFHWPPFYSIGHLHLHVISPASDMSFVSQLIFRNNSWWFVSPEYVKSRL